MRWMAHGTRTPGGDQDPESRRHSWQRSALARAGGLGDADYVAIVERLDRAIAEVDGRGIAVTPFGHEAALSERLGFDARGVWVKDETGNVAGSHRARHLMGASLWLETMERLGRAMRDPRGGPAPAIASCGNAALAAARESLEYAATHRSEFMWPWEETPRSITSGILDDDTYDWHAVVSGTIESGGWPLAVPEEALREAHDHARSATGSRASRTGVAGLAGPIELRRAVAVASGETVAVLFTGAER